MKAIAEHDRPREKLARRGAHELVAIVLGQGQPRASALDLANSVLAKLGGVAGLARAATDELTRVGGIGPARAAQILAAVELGRRTVGQAATPRAQMANPRAVAEYLLPQFGKHRVLRCTVLSVGTLDASIVHPREVFREAVAGGAAAIVVFHNHPSGDPEPSPEDTKLTERLMAAGVLMGISVLDHVILGDARYFSYREKGSI